MAEEKKQTTKTTKAAEAKKPAEKKTAAKKPAEKKTAAKKPAAKSTAKKAPAKKATSTAAKKPAAKKSTAKASTKSTSKPAAKKTAAKSTAKKTVTKKASASTAKKTEAKKTSPKKTVKQSSADSLLGIKDSKKVSAEDKKEKQNKFETDKAKYLADQKKKAEDKKKKKLAKKAKGNAVSNFLKDKSAKRKMKKMEKAEAAPKYSIREVKIMRKRVFIIVAMCVALTFGFLFVFKLFGALQLNAGYAAKVGDKYITEAEVTKYIKEQTLYKNYAKSSSQWQQYIGMYGMTSETFRNQVIESKFKHEELVRLAAEQEGITVSDEEVDAHVQSFKNKYTSDANYKKALENAGYTEETYRDYVYQSMLEKALIAKVITVDTPSDEDVKTYLSSASTAYKDARKSSHILFNAKDEQTAQSVLDQLNAGSLKWEDAVNKYSIDEKTKASGGNVGWDKIESFSASYNDGLSGLAAGEICKELVTDKDGIHIIKCTEKWDTPEKIESLDGVPQDIIEECRTKKKESNQATELKTWLDNFASENGIESEIYPMPKDVPYYVEPKTQINSNALGGASAAGGAGGSVPISTE